MSGIFNNGLEMKLTGFTPIQTKIRTCMEYPSSWTLDLYPIWTLLKLRITAQDPLIKVIITITGYWRCKQDKNQDLQFTKVLNLG